MDSDPSSSSGMALEYVACRHTSVAGSSGLFNDAELNGKDVWEAIAQFARHSAFAWKDAGGEGGPPKVLSLCTGLQAEI
jgi:hypothetical protein